MAESSDIDIDVLKKILGRRLNNKEKELVHNFESESKMNCQIQLLHEYIDNDNLYIPEITDMHGSCLFECFKICGLCDDINEIRKILGNAFLLFKNLRILPQQEMTLLECFSVRNEIEYCVAEETQKVYKYNYDLMCIDIQKDSGWDRVDTELLLSFMSALFNLKFYIYKINRNDECSKMVISCTEQNEDTKTIYLGHIREVHYIPILENTDNYIYTVAKYTNAKKKFYKWLKQINTI